MVKFSKSTIDDCHIVSLGKVTNEAGNLTVLENLVTIPFEVKRLYYLYDVPGGEERGGHAHYALEQYIIAASGSFDVLLDDGKNKKRVFLNRPYEALHIVPGLWRELDNFSSGSICMVLASHLFDAADYMRNYGLFKKYKEQ